MDNNNEQGDTCLKTVKGELIHGSGRNPESTPSWALYY